MARRVPREHLQPVLLDRLSDDLTSATGELAAKRRALTGRLDAERAAALEALLADDSLSTRPLRQADLAAFDGLDDDSRALIGRVVELEQACRMEVRRAYAVSMEQLRASVLRELANLLNAQCAETLTEETAQGPVSLFDGLTHARDSVLNYGIPALSGRIRTEADCAELAQGIERAIRRFEPRLTNVRVSAEAHREGGMAAVRSPVALTIDGELWGYPVSEEMRLRTVIDLEKGEARIEPAGTGGQTGGGGA